MKDDRHIDVQSERAVRIRLDVRVSLGPGPGFGGLQQIGDVYLKRSDCDLLGVV
jgi:hypothetical protein